jgi:hypothetical protein
MAGFDPTWPGMRPQLASKTGNSRAIYIQRKATASHGRLKTFPTYSQSRATHCTRPYRSPGGSRSSARKKPNGIFGGKMCNLGRGSKIGPRPICLRIPPQVTILRNAVAFPCAPRPFIYGKFPEQRESMVAEAIATTTQPRDASTPGISCPGAPVAHGWRCS